MDCHSKLKHLVLDIEASSIGRLKHLVLDIEASSIGTLKHLLLDIEVSSTGTLKHLLLESGSLEYCALLHSHTEGRKVGAI